MPLPEQAALERYVELTMVALRAAGVSPDTGDQKPLPPQPKRTVYRESVKDLLDTGLLKAGTHLYPLRQKLTETALVLESGNLEVKGQEFGSVSSAATAVSGNKAEAGWEFWGAPSGEGGFVSLFELRKRLREETGKQETSPGPASGAAKEAQASASQGPRRFSEKIPDLISAGLLNLGEPLRPTRKALAGVEAKVASDGRIELNGELFASPSAAAVAASGMKAEAGWEFWAVERNGEWVSLYSLRDQLRNAE